MDAYLRQKSYTFQSLGFENRHDSLDDGVVVTTEGLILKDS